MEENLFYNRSSTFSYRWLIPAAILAIFVGWLIAGKGMAIGSVILLLPFITGFLILVFFKPKVGFIVFIIYCFLVPDLIKHVTGAPLGLGQDGILVLTWLGIIFYRTKRFRARHLNNDLVWLSIVWLAITVLEIANTERPSIVGWFYEGRSITFYQVLSIPLGFLVFNKKKDINLFLFIIIFISVLGALYGIKQLTIGVDGAENQWLEDGAKKTHILNGKLRVFSFYTEAAQYGASMAHLAVISFILALGPYTISKKTLFTIAGLLTLYGMLISGTRSAFFVLIGGFFLYLILSKKVTILIIGSIVGMLFFGMLKFTTVGSGNAQIVRLRTAVDPNDPSFQVRLSNQRILKNFLSTRPFGAGVGVLGTWGVLYNKDKFISTIPPDSLFVKVWAMYGIVGFLLWFGIMVYIVGKMIGIVWKTRDPVLRNKLAALCCGATGILLCSYGNEVMNQMPSSIIVYVSWLLVWLSPRWDTPLPKSIEV